MLNEDDYVLDDDDIQSVDFEDMDTNVIKHSKVLLRLRIGDLAERIAMLSFDPGACSDAAKIIQLVEDEGLWK